MGGRGTWTVCVMAGGEVAGQVTVGHVGQDGLGHCQLLVCSGASRSSSRSLILDFLLKMEADLALRDLELISLAFMHFLQ